jgi:hypothetical protein
LVFVWDNEKEYIIDWRNKQKYIFYFIKIFIWDDYLIILAGLLFPEDGQHAHNGMLILVLLVVIKV